MGSEHRKLTDGDGGHQGEAGPPQGGGQNKGSEQKRLREEGPRTQKVFRLPFCCCLIKPKGRAMGGSVLKQLLQTLTSSWAHSSPLPPCPSTNADTSEHGSAETPVPRFRWQLRVLPHPRNRVCTSVGGETLNPQETSLGRCWQEHLPLEHSSATLLHWESTGDGTGTKKARVMETRSHWVPSRAPPQDQSSTPGAVGSCSASQFHTGEGAT